MTAPPVSVVIPAFNRAGSIGLAIASVLRQSYPDFELLVVDDGSTDGTRDVVRGVADPRLKLIETPRNMGASAARNLGIEAARGAWVAFQDSDDEWLPLKLEKQMARLLAPGADFVAAYCGMLILGAPDPVPEANPEANAGSNLGANPGSNLGATPGAKPGATPARLQTRYFPGPEETALEGDLLLPLLRTSLISTQTLVARRDRLRAIGGFDPDLRALIDWDCVLRLAPLGPIAFVDEPLAIQRFSPDSITRDRARKLAAQIRVAEKHAALLGRHPAIHARHHYVIAGGHRRAGDLAGARASLARARDLAPGVPRYWAMSLWVATLTLAQQGRTALPAAR